MRLVIKSENGDVLFDGTGFDIEFSNQAKTARLIRDFNGGTLGNITEQTKSERVSYKFDYRGGYFPLSHEFVHRDTLEVRVGDVKIPPSMLVVDNNMMTIMSEEMNMAAQDAPVPIDVSYCYKKPVIILCEAVGEEFFEGLCYIEEYCIEREKGQWNFTKEQVVFFVESQAWK